jgi:hypothetical protein
VAGQADSQGLQEVVTVMIVDAALEHTCAEFRSRAAGGQITAAERDLLIDGAVLLAAGIEELLQDARVDVPRGWRGDGSPIDNRRSRVAT